MKLFTYRHPSGVPNFGDELNPEIFPPLLPGCFDDDDRALFLGIGSILFDFLAPGAPKYVVGSGYGGYTKPPRLDATWRIYGVRGPLTCRALGLDPSLAIGDPAILLRDTVQAGRPKRFKASFMPHWQSLPRGQWQRAAGLAGINLIDPRAPVEDVIDQILASEVLLAEAMHGAIVADALRVPWVALLPIDPVHRFKWDDWAQSLGIALRPQHLAASSLAERLEAVRIGRRAPGRRLMRAMPGLARVAAARFAEQAAASLARALGTEPTLSADAMLDAAIGRIHEAIGAFRREQGGAAA